MLQYSLIGIKPDAFAPNARREQGSELREKLPEDPKDFINEFKNLLRSKLLRIITEKT